MANEHEAKGFTYWLPTIHLPSNARGVLFDFDLPINQNTILTTYNNKYNYPDFILKNMPAELQSNDFEIQEEGHDSVKLDLVIKPQNIDINKKVAAYKTRYLFSADKAINVCLLNNKATTCQSLGINFNDDELINKLIATKQLQDVTTIIAEKSNGLFRIEPKNGFQRGKTYRVKYLPVSPQYALSHWRFPSQISVIIDDKAIKPTKSDVFRLKLDGVLIKQLLRLPNQASCSGDVLVNMQKLYYEVPNSYVPYRQLMLFHTQRKIKRGVHSTNTSFSDFEPWRYTSSLMGGRDIGIGTEIIFEQCSYDKGEASTSYVRGFAGLLELEDKLYATQILKVKFDPFDCQTGAK